MAEMRVERIGNELVVVTPDSAPLTIHPLWLRERCRDEASFDRRTEQRLFNPSELDLEVAITALGEPRPGTFDITFSDGHVGRYAAAAILAEHAQFSGTDGMLECLPWAADLADWPEGRWQDRTDRAALQAMVGHYLRFGFLLLHGVPTEPGAVLAAARLFGHVRETNFGALFDVRSEPEASDLAYTSLPLDPHTDNPYRSPVPGIQLLHCLKNETSGGLSTLVDGLAAATALRHQNPAAWEALTSVPVGFRYIDATTELCATAPVIELDHQGEFHAIRYSPRLDYVPLLPAAKLAAFYRARRLLDQLLRSCAYEIRFRLCDGDLVMFDNRRLLHGRTGFDPGEGLRHLQGCYIDSDGPRSLYRVLCRPQAEGFR